ncbi:DUF975 family protein [Deltaproteobacteria bacterium]|nr:DUF975 family protein [Deltaproteobacteria bacterium]
MADLVRTDNKTLMYQARESLRGLWGLAVATFFIYMILFVVVQMIPRAGWLISILITGPMSVGACIFSIAIARKQDPQLSQIFQGFQKFGVSLGAYILQMIFILLWTLLLIIPGIVAALSYYMTFFIIAENDSIGPLEAIRKSKEMMYGNKWKLFCLFLRFLGWALLCLLTLGIGFLWLTPYMFISCAKFYDDVRYNNGVEHEEDTGFTFST